MVTLGNFDYTAHKQLYDKLISDAATHHVTGQLA
jgi:hypothetical protein